MVAIKYRTISSARSRRSLPVMTLGVGAKDFHALRHSTPGAEHAETHIPSRATRRVDSRSSQSRGKTEPRGNENPNLCATSTHSPGEQEPSHWRCGAVVGCDQRAICRSEKYKPGFLWLCDCSDRGLWPRRHFTR